jgi:hypothetical protein
LQCFSLGYLSENKDNSENFRPVRSTDRLSQTRVLYEVPFLVALPEIVMKGL